MLQIEQLSQLAEQGVDRNFGCTKQLWVQDSAD